jgi:hypothetical protein
MVEILHRPVGSFEHKALDPPQDGEVRGMIGAATGRPVTTARRIAVTNRT